jgi:hypothetical protein
MIIGGDFHRFTGLAGVLPDEPTIRDSRGGQRCVVLIVDGTMLVGPPPPARQQLQRYGLSCGTGLYVTGSPTKPPR